MPLLHKLFLHQFRLLYYLLRGFLWCCPKLCISILGSNEALTYDRRDLHLNLVLFFVVLSWSIINTVTVTNLKFSAQLIFTDLILTSCRTFPLSPKLTLYHLLVQYPSEGITVLNSSNRVCFFLLFHEINIYQINWNIKVFILFLSGLFNLTLIGEVNPWCCMDSKICSLLSLYALPSNTFTIIYSSNLFPNFSS